MKRWRLWVVLCFSLIGIVGSLIATYQYFQILQTGFEEKSFCTISEFVNCDVAYASSHARLFGIPLSWLGVVFYLWMVILVAWILIKKRDAENIGSFAWLLSSGAVGMSVYKAYVSFAVLHVLCLICASLYFVNLVLFLAWHSFLKIGFKNRGAFCLKPQFLSLTIASCLLFGAAYLAMGGYQSSVTRELRLELPVSEIIPFHFRQSQYQFEEDPAAPVWGNPGAKIHVVEFSDFQCPYCKRAAFHLKPTLTEFKEKVALYFYQFPLDLACNEKITSGMHDKACLAAQASLCAQAEGNFWDYHDDIFRNQKRLGRELLMELAQKRGWDTKKFEACLENPAILNKVKNHIVRGNKIYVEGTPTVLVNNRRVKYWSNPEVLRAIIKEEIRRLPQ